MATDWGTPPWHIAIAIPPHPVPHRCDVAVVGAGLTGLSAAYHLARGGVRTAVLEAGTIGAGASGRTGAIVLEGTAAGPLEDVDDCLDAVARVTRKAGIACELRLDGCHELAHQRGPGPLTPLWHDVDGDLCLAGMEPGGTVDAGALLAGLARAAQEAGATIHEGVAVTSIEPGPSIVLHAGPATVHAGHVVVALNAYTTTVLPLPVTPTPALTLALCTEPLPEAALETIGLGDRRPFYTVDLPYLWGRTLGDGRVVFGAGLVFPDDGDVRTVDLRSPGAAGTMARLETRVRGLHLALADVRVTLRWGGPIAFLGRPPLLGPHPDAPNILVTGAYAGHGVALGVRVGELVAAAVTTGRRLPSWGALVG